MIQGEVLRVRPVARPTGYSGRRSASRSCNRGAVRRVPPTFAIPTDPASIPGLPRVVGIVVLVISLLSSHPGQASAQAARSPATPNPAHERLASFEGTWTHLEAPPGRGARDTCGWMAGGRRHMICRRQMESPNGVMEQVMVYSYRGADTTYTVTVLLPGGQVWRYAGRPDADRWEFLLEPGRADPQQRLRQVVRVTGDTLHFREEASVNGGPWRLTDPSEDYRYVRVRETPH